MTTPMRQIAMRLAALAAGAALLGCQPTEAPSASERAAPTASSDGPQTAPKAPPIAVPGRNVSAQDSALASRIESALAAETALHGSRIGVVAADGVVTLTGSTRSPDLRSMAAQIALSVNGVRLVRNELSIALST